MIENRKDEDKSDDIIRPDSNQIPYEQKQDFDIKSFFIDDLFTLDTKKLTEIQQYLLVRNMNQIEKLESFQNKDNGEALSNLLKSQAINDGFLK